MQNNVEIIQINISGEDKPGMTSSLSEILARYDAFILDIGQANIHQSLTLGILFKTTSDKSGNIMKELLFKASELGESHGVLQAGRMPAAGSGFATDYIGSKAALDAAVTRNGEALEPIAPTLLSPGELTPERCGTLVRIGALSYTPEDLTPGTWAGYKRFTDDTGAAVYTYVRSYARFADDEVPVGRCTLTGILQYDATGEGRYILKLRDENDWTR